MASFRATLELGGKTATGIRVPPSAVAALGAGKRVAVVVTINGTYTYRSTIAPYAGDLMLPVSAEHREGAGIRAGDVVEVTLALDDQPRTVDLPPELAAALAADPAAQAAFDRLSYTVRKEHARAITEAKAEDAKARRLAKALASLRT